TPTMAWFRSSSQKHKSAHKAQAAARRRTLTLETLETRDVFAFALSLMSSPGTTNVGDANSINGDISDDSRYVVFQSDADNLVAGDVNGSTDIFMKDRLTGTLYLISTSTTGVLGDFDSTNPVISGDGNYIAWESNADNLVANDNNN